MSSFRLTTINIYPLKSAKAVTLKHSQVQSQGLQYDRRWMLVDEHGQFISARKHPKLLQVYAEASVKGLHIRLPGKALVHIPLPTHTPTATVTLWGQQCHVLPAGTHYDRLFSDYLQHPCRVVTASPRHPRRIDPTYAQPTDQVSFADGFPLLLISENSLADLNHRLDTPVSMSHFRPNLVVTASQAFEEDQWRSIRINHVRFSLVKPCSRCIITTLDPESGQSQPQGEPLRTLKQYRQKDHQVFFGQNVIAHNPGKICVNDPIEILE